VDGGEEELLHDFDVLGTRGFEQDNTKKLDRLDPLKNCRRDKSTRNRLEYFTEAFVIVVEIGTRIFFFKSIFARFS
jgi:hypothetical protein